LILILILILIGFNWNFLNSFEIPPRVPLLLFCLQQTFSYSGFNQDIGSWNVASVSNM